MAAEDDDRRELDWDLVVGVPQIGVHRTIRVTSNESVGTVMIKIATKLGAAYMIIHQIYYSCFVSDCFPLESSIKVNACVSLGLDVS